MRIEMNRGVAVLVSDDDAEWIQKHRWFVEERKTGKTNLRYTVKRLSRKNGVVGCTYLNRAIFEKANPGIELTRSTYIIQRTEPEDRKVLDFRRENLQATNNSHAMSQIRPSRGTSKYKGVYKTTAEPDVWRAMITIEGRKRTLGRFETEEDAARAYDHAALQHNPDYKHINFPDERKLHI